MIPKELRENNHFTGYDIACAALILLPIALMAGAFTAWLTITLG